MAPGAYGFAFVTPSTDLTPGGLDLLEAAWPSELTITWELRSPDVDVEEVGRDEVRWGFRGVSSFIARREPSSIHLVRPVLPSLEALVHPILTVPLAVVARWRGDLTLHAGAFQHEGGAWALMGTREAGKSTLLAGLARRGVPVVADDLVCVQDRSVWSGPACVDLRPDVAPRFEGTRPIGEVAGRARTRLSAPPAEPRLPLRGSVVLAWSDDSTLSVRRLGAEEALRLVIAQEYIRLVGDSDALQVLDVASLPVLEVTRPRDWSREDEVLDLLLEACAEA